MADRAGLTKSLAEIAHAAVRDRQARAAALGAAAGACI
jgi:hypothetical protein